MAYVKLQAATDRFLMKRGGTAFYYKRDIPKQFHVLLGRTSWWIKLPENPDDARQEARSLRQRHDKILAGLRSPDIQRLIRQSENDVVLREVLDELEGERLTEEPIGPDALRKSADELRSDLRHRLTVQRAIKAETESAETLAPLVNILNAEPETSLPRLSKVAEQWNKRTAPSKGTLKIRTTILRRVREAIGDPPVAEVTRPMVREFIGQIERLPSQIGLPAGMRTASLPALLDWAEKNPKHPRVFPITIRNHAMTLRSLLSWAVRQDIITSNPSLNIDLADDERDKTRDKHHAALQWKDMPAFMTKLRATTGTPAGALEFAILTAARTDQALGAEWREIDLTTRVWTVPKHRMKGGLRDHRVFLSQAAIDVLPDKVGSYVFKRERKDRPLPDNAMRKLLNIVWPGVTVHGFRSSFRDWAAEATTHPGEVAEMALAHTVGNAVEAAYRRGDMLAKRSKLMEDWADYVAPK